MRPTMHQNPARTSWGSALKHTTMAQWYALLLLDSLYDMLHDRLSYRLSTLRTQYATLFKKNKK
jgi:hypothetical protein